MKRTSLLVFNSQMEVVSKVENKGTHMPITEAIQTTSIEPKDIIELSVLEKSSKSDFFIVGNYIGYIDNGELNIYIIQNIEEINAVNKNVICEGAYVELCYELGNMKNFANASITEILTEMLKDSSWTIGNVEMEERHEFTISLTDKLSVLRRLANLFQCDLYFTYEIKEDGSIAKKINMTKSRGKNTGKRFEYGKDIVEITRNVDLSEVRTAMVGIGKSYKDSFENEKRTNFVDVEWSIANGNVLDKPKGQAYIEDPTAKALFGLDGGKRNRMGFYENGEIHDVDYLIAKTCQELLSNNKPKITYEMNVLDLYRILGYEHEMVSIGDQVIIIDTEFKIPLRVEAEVIEIKKDLLDPSSTMITLGNFKDNFTDDFDRLKQLEEKLDENQGIWDDKLDGGSKVHFCEFGTLTYNGTSDAVLTYNFSQVYVDLPSIQASIQLKDENVDSAIRETTVTSVQPITNPSGHYIGGKVKVHRGESTQRTFFITIQAMCSSPVNI